MKRKSKAPRIYDILDFKEEQSIAIISSKHRVFFDLAKKILCLANDIFPFKSNGKKTKRTVKSGVENALLALYTQSFRLYRAVITLCKLGLDSEASILLRSMLDSVSYLLYIAEKDHEERLTHYLCSRALSDRKAVTCGIAIFPNWKNDINVKWFEDNEKAAIEYFKSKHGKDISIDDIKTKHTLRADICAQRIEFDALAKQYQTFYRYASSIAHGENLLEFIKPSSNPEELLLTSGPTDKSISFCLENAMALILCAMDRVNDIVLEIGHNEEIKKLSDEWTKLVEEDNVKEVKGRVT